jgi:hypothetical protein
MISSSLSPFEKAVAGSTPFLFAQDFPGKVFKPVHPCEKGFYEALEAKKNASLKKLVPKYFGTLTLKPSEECKLSDELRDTPTEYLVLEDLTHDFIHPCILDVKLGITHHDINLEDPHSHLLRKSKYITTPSLGFCLTGMQVFKSTTGGFEFMDKIQGRELTETTIASKLHYFFHNGSILRDDVISLLLQRLKHVSMYFENEPDFLFRSTSLLLIYEGQPGSDTRVDARMIDFAHAKQMPNRQYRDEYGYLFGTKNLMKILESILQPPALSTAPSK